MKQNIFYEVFLDYIQDLYDAEKQIVNTLKELIHEASHDELKHSLSNHLEETKVQVKRLEKIFHHLNETPKAKTCKGIKGLIEEGKEIFQKYDLSPTLKDCFIIISTQKIEHYEISAYGSACSLAKLMMSAYHDKSHFKEIYKLLDETLQEEGKADKKLTKVAEGKLFLEGVNEELEKEIKANK